MLRGIPCARAALLPLRHSCRLLLAGIEDAAAACARPAAPSLPSSASGHKAPQVRCKQPATSDPGGCSQRTCGVLWPVLDASVILDELWARQCNHPRRWRVRRLHLLSTPPVLLAKLFCPKSAPLPQLSALTHTHLQHQATLHSSTAQLSSADVNDLDDAGVADAV